MSNEIVNNQQKNVQALTTVQALKQMLGSEEIKKRFNEIMGSKSGGFMASIINVVNSTKELQNVDANSIIMSALVSATLELPVDKNLGYAYILPYNTKQKDGSYKQLASFQLGYKGIIQLAMRSGQYKTINVSEVYDGELIGFNRMTGEIEFDSKQKKNEKIIGYVAYFKLLNGFEKTIYMTKEEVTAHAKKYSKTFGNQYGVWVTDFDSMACKTVLKRLLSKYGILSIEMQKGINLDQAVIKNEDGTDYEYPDRTEMQNAKEIDITPHEEIKDEIPQQQETIQADATGEVKEVKTTGKKVDGKLKFD